MLTALILTALVLGIIYASRRWPDVEARFFGVDKVDVPKSETAEPDPIARTKGAVKEHARSASRVADSTVQKFSVTKDKVTEFAGGLFKKKQIQDEPEVHEDAAPVEVDETPAAAADEPMFTTKSLSEDEVTTEPAGVKPDEDEAVIPTAKAPSTRAPGERVTSVPARPSQPAYLDGTKTVGDNFEQLSAEADQAWRDREYERCEEACLKILVQQPKNIKYMTRIGQVYQQLGQLDDAKEAFEAAKKLDPKNFFVLNRLAEVERMLTDKKGRTQLNKVLKK